MNALTNLSPRRKIASIVLALALVGTGISSLAQIQDTLVNTVNYSVATLDLQGSHDGTTFTQSTTLNWPIEGGLEQNKLLYIKNAGNTAAVNMSAVATGTGSADLTSRIFRFYKVVAPADCPAFGGPAGTAIILNAGAGQTIASASTGVNFSVPAAATVFMCLSVGSGTAPAAGSTAVQTITWTGQSA